MTTYHESIRSPYVADIPHLSTYDEVCEVLRSPKFVQGAFTISEEVLLARSVPVLDGAEHIARRRVEAHLFSEQAIENYRTDILAPMIDMLLDERRKPDPQHGAEINLVELTWEMLARVAAAIIGLDGVTTSADVRRFIGYVRDIGQAVTVEWATTDKDQIIERGLAARREFCELYFDASAARRRELVRRSVAGEIAAEDVPRDLLTCLYQHWDPTWDDELPLREATLYLVAATQTTVQALPNFVVCLESWLAEHPEVRPRIASDPGFLRSAAFESLRMFVASPVRIRRATEDVTLKSGRTIKAGERVGLLFLDANQNAEMFGVGADRYDPNRELTTRAPWGLAFGTGPHSCIGRPLVTGLVGSNRQVDGTMVVMARRLYAAGMRLDESKPVLRDEGTFHVAYADVPVVLDPLQPAGAS